MSQSVHTRFVASSRRVMRVFAAVIAVGLLNCPGASADVTTWIAPGGGDWSDAASWSPGMPTAADQAVFAGQPAGMSNVRIDGPFSINSVRFSGQKPWFLSPGDGGGLTFTGTAPATLWVDAAGTYNQTIAAPMTLDSPLEVINESGKSLTLSGAISGPGSLAMSKGLIYVAGANTYTGETIIRGGDVRMTHPDAFGSVDVGTTVSKGKLVVSTDTLEPITVSDGGLVVLNHLPTYNTSFTIERGMIELADYAAGQTTLSQPITLVGHGTGQVHSDGRRLVLAGGVAGVGDLRLTGDRITIDGMLGHDGKLLVDSWRTAINGPVKFTGPLEVSPYGGLDLNVDATVSAVVAGGFIRIAPGKQLTAQAPAISLTGGGIDGRINAAHIVVTSGGVLRNLGDYAGTIEVTAGTLWAGGTDGLGSASAGTRIASRRGAVLDLYASTAEPIALNDAAGFGGGALICTQPDNVEPVVHSGPLQLGEIGSSVGGTITLAGPIAGGSLDIVWPVFLQARPPMASTLVRIDGSGSTYSGPTRVASKAVLAVGPGGRLDSTSRLHLAGELRLESAGIGDQIADSIPITMAGGTINLAAGAESLGPVTLDRYTNDLRAGVAGTALTLDALTRRPTAIARFSGTAGQLGGPADTDPRIFITSAPTLTNGIIGGWAVSGSRFATYGSNGVSAFDSEAADLNSAGPADNVSIASPATLTGPRTVYSLRFEPGQALDLGQHALEIGSGGIILQSTAIQNGQLLPGEHAAGQLMIHLTGGGNTLNAGTADTDRGRTTLILSGGTGSLTGVNTHTGGTIIDKATITIASPAALPVGGDLDVNDAQVNMGAGSAPLKLGAVTLSGTCILQGTTPVDAESWIVERGLIQVPLAGSGTITKSSPGLLSISGDSPQYTGLIDVREGILRARGVGHGLIRIGEGAVLQSGRIVATPVELNGGSLMAGQYTGGITVTAPSTLLGGYGEGDDEIDIAGPLIVRAGGSPRVSGPVWSRVWTRVSGDIHVDGELTDSSLSLFTLNLLGNASRTISGGGRIGVPLEIKAGQVLAPGNGVGTLTVHSIGWSSGGTYRWEIANADGTPGIDWDLLHITGGLGIYAPDKPFTLQVVPASLSESAGALPEFDPARSYTWLIATLMHDRSFGPLDLSMLRIDAEAFLAHNELAGGSFSIAERGNSLDLQFTPVPEPGLLPCISIGLVLLQRRRGCILRADRTP